VGCALAKGSASLISAFVITWSARRLGLEDGFIKLNMKAKIVSTGEIDV
jgi:hypothetical protein